MTMSNKVPLADQEQYTYENDAKARRVIIVDSSGNVIKTTQVEENRSGSDANGSDGATGRVLTLQNTSESGAPISVWIDDQIIAQEDMTISHLSENSTITFNINLFDSQTVRVLYYI